MALSAIRRNATSWRKRSASATRAEGAALDQASVGSSGCRVRHPPATALERTVLPLRQGFPLDNSWIHAVYAREFARSWLLAYNPGVAATGETSPLWAIVLAPIHRWAPTVEAVVAGTKVFGFALHAAAAATIAWTVSLRTRETQSFVWFGAALALVHPDLVAASVSGMEVPLASLMVAVVVAGVIHGSWPTVMISAMLATLSRPEAAVIAASFPIFLARDGLRSSLRLSTAAVGGAATATVAVGVRNYYVSGLFLPATFHAKVGTSALFDVSSQKLGFESLLGQFALLNHLAVLMVLLCTSVVLAISLKTKSTHRIGAAACLSGFLFMAVSFMLITPADPAAFYHQRYALPGVFMVVVSLPMISMGVLCRLNGPARSFLAVAGLIAVTAVALRASPNRYRHLSNDAKNIDDVQVRLGKALESVSSAENAWVVDAGASRFFGNAHVVDLMGLNTPEMLRHDAQAYLDAHPPRYLDLFTGWSTIQSDVAFPRRRFEATTRYTVTSSAEMRQHVLLDCVPPGQTGHISVRRGRFSFRCAP